MTDRKDRIAATAERKRRLGKHREADMLEMLAKEAHTIRDQ